MKKTVISLSLACLVCLTVLSGNVFAAYINKEFSGGEVRIYYSTTAPQTTDAVIIGVGTAMSRSDYSKLSSEIIKYGYVVVIFDDYPGWMVKSDKDRFAAGVYQIKASLVSWLAGTNITSRP